MSVASYIHQKLCIYIDIYASLHGEWITYKVYERYQTQYLFNYYHTDINRCLVYNYAGKCTIEMHLRCFKNTNSCLA